MASKERPISLHLTAYQVGFGDCILLTFGYPSGNRHVLIDFGSTRYPPDEPGLIKRVAQKIKKDCGGDLDVVVATHRHKDHISGFATNARKTGPGDIIKSCNPRVILQPWTEHPDAQPDATSAPSRSGLRARRRSFAKSLADMQGFAAGVEAEARRLGTRLGIDLTELSYLGENNISNKLAVENLMTMGSRRLYLNYASRLNLRRQLPGVTVRVLGPPSLEQSEKIRKQRHKDEEEFWHLQAQAGTFARLPAARLFPRASTMRASDTTTRWFIDRITNARVEQLHAIVTALDRSLNNTSLILLFEVGNKKLLFPGDAQIENWSYALSKSHVRTRLRNVDVYKVGHHGSLNATPKSLWKLFRKRGPTPKSNRLSTVLSTLSDVHGSEGRNTEVPRRALVDELREKSVYFSTQDLEKPKLSKTIKIFDKK